MKDKLRIPMIVLISACSTAALVSTLMFLNYHVFDRPTDHVGIVWAVSAACMVIAVFIAGSLMRRLDDRENSSRAAGEFLAGMGEKMRAPLNAVVSLSGLMLDRGNLDGNDSVNVDNIYNAGTTLLGMVNGILDISRMEAGKFELMPAEYDLPSLLNSVIAQSVMYRGEKPIKFDLNINEYLPERLYGDGPRVRQIMDNILSNAFKYTQEGSVELGIRCAREGKTARITIWVRDTGAGMREKDLDNLFTGCGKDGAWDYGIPMNGLRLSVTKKIAEMMNGSVGVASSYGKGSVFTVKICQQFVNEDTIGAKTVKDLMDFSCGYSRRNIRSQQARVMLPYDWVRDIDGSDDNYTYSDSDMDKTPCWRQIYADTQDDPNVRSGQERRNLMSRRSGVDRRDLSDKIAGLNISNGIKRFGGDKENYFQILRSFAENVPHALDAVRYVTEEDLPNYAVKVYALKSASWNICAEITGDMAEILEKAAKAGNFAFVNIHNAPFVEAVETLAADIEDMLAKHFELNPKPQKDKPDDKTLSKLLTACSNYDMDGADAAMDEIERYRYGSGSGLADWLRENIGKMNFVQIRGKLAELLEQNGGYNYGEKTK